MPGRPGSRLLRRACLPALLVVALLSAGCEPEAPAPEEEDPYFAADHVLDVTIDLAPEDWDTLRRQTRTISDILGGDCLDAPQEKIFTFFPATVSVDGETLTEVGVRKKGFLGSLSDTKPSLKIRFDKFVDDQLLGGEMKRMTLNNVQQDRSRLNTCMTYKVFADAGLPSPRCNFARVHINGADYGLFVHVESIKKAFLERTFENAEGNLYEGTISDFQPGWRGTFQKKTNETENDWSDIEAVVSALEDPSAAGLDALAAVVDIDHFLSFWALEVITGHWDGYTGDRNNYYIYRPTGGRFSFIPWGPDSAFAPLDHPFDDELYPQSVMARTAIPHRLYHDPSSRDAYVQRLRDLLDSAWNESALLEEIDRMAAIVQSHALPDTRLAAQSDTSRLRDFVTYRRNQVLDELSPEPPDWSWPLQPPNICWEELGAVDLEFEAEWAGSDAPGASPGDIIGEGEVDLLSYVFEGQSLDFVAEGTSSGIEQEGERAGAARVTIAHVMESGTVDLLVIYTAPEALVPGATLPFDMFITSGFRVLIPPPYSDLFVVANLGSGELQLDQASTIVGAAISGRIHGTFFGFGGER